MEENYNKEEHKKLITKMKGHIQSEKAQRIEGCFRYSIPAYLYLEEGPFENDKGKLLAFVNATDNSIITVVNAIDETGNFGLNTRPQQSLVLRLRGGPDFPKASR